MVSDPFTDAVVWTSWIYQMCEHGFKNRLILMDLINDDITDFANGALFTMT